MSKKTRKAAHPHRGRWQAQGSDIKRKGGYSREWGQPTALTKDEGLTLLANLATLCEERERVLREVACAKAKRFVTRLSDQGHPMLSSKSFYVGPGNRRFRDARIDLEITAGIAFV